MFNTFPFCRRLLRGYHSSPGPLHSHDSNHFESPPSRFVVPARTENHTDYFSGMDGYHFIDAKFGQESGYNQEGCKSNHHDINIYALLKGRQSL